MAKAKKVVPLIDISGKAREAALDLLTCGTKLQETISTGKDTYFSKVRDYNVAGCSFEEMEAAQPDLKKIQAYRSAKSAIKAAKEQGVSLFNADGSPKGRTALEKEAKAAKIKAEEGDVGETPSQDGVTMTVHYATVADMMADAFKLLKANKEVRHSYLIDVREVARMLANEEAEAKAAQEKADEEAKAKADADKQAQAARDAEIAALIAADAKRAQDAAAQAAKRKPVSAKAAKKAAQKAAHMQAQSMQKAA